MKKIISLLLVLVMCCSLLAACAPEATVGGPTLEEAAEYLNSSYLSDDGKKTPANYKMPAQVPIGDVKFPVTWTCSLDTIQIVLENGLYTIKVPNKNETEVEYTLTATVKDAAGNSKTLTFKRVLPVYDNSASVTAPVEGEAYKLYMVQATVGKTLFALNETQKEGDKDKYIKTDVDPKKAADFYAEKAEGGYKFYTTIDGTKYYLTASTTTAEDGKVSKYIGLAADGASVYTYKAETKAWYTTCENQEYVVGTYSSHETICISESSYMTAENTGVSQFPMCLMAKDAAEAMAPTEGPKDPTELTTIPAFTDIALALENEKQTVEKYLVKGVIVEIKSTQYGNMYIEDEAGNKLYVYGVYDKTGDNRYDAMATQPQVGDTVTLMGVACNYNGAQMKNGWVQELIPGEGGGNEGGGNEGGDITEPATLPTVIAPEAGTAYKFGIIQVTNGHTVYIAGGIDQDRFLVTTEDKAAALDVYVETSGDGYKFSTTIDGAKVYITLGLNEAGKVALSYGAEGTVWTYDATISAWCADLDGTMYYMGSYNTFDTISASKTSYISEDNKGVTQFPAGFFAEEGETAEPATLPTVTAPEAGTAYKFGIIQVTNGHTVYIAGGIDQDRFLVTTEDKAAALDVYVEASGDGYKFSTTIDGAKVYITLGLNEAGKVALSYGAEGTVWTYDATISAWCADLDGTMYYMGSYNTFDTISASKTSYISEENKGVTQFPAGFFAAA